MRSGDKHNNQKLNEISRRRESFDAACDPAIQYAWLEQIQRPVPAIAAFAETWSTTKRVRTVESDASITTRRYPPGLRVAASALRGFADVQNQALHIRM
jgi:hypothetical protein